MIYMGLKKWKRALLFLEIVIMSPVVNNVSKIQVDAYKKWVLVSLLYKGHVSNVNGPESITRAFSDKFICSHWTCRKQSVNRLQSSIMQPAKLMMDWPRSSKMASSMRSPIKDSLLKLLLVKYGGLQ